MKRRQAFIVVMLSVAILVVLGLLAQAPTADAQTYQYKWRMSQTHPADSPFGRAAEAFAAEVKQRTNGRIEITVYHAGVLGDWTLSDELVMRGSVELNLGPVAPTYDPRLNIAYYTPYLFKTFKEGRAAYAKGGWIN